MFSSTTVNLVSWSAAVPSSVSTLTSSSATELFPSSPPFSSRTVTRKSRARVVSCKSVKRYQQNGNEKLQEHDDKWLNDGNVLSWQNTYCQYFQEFQSLFVPGSKSFHPGWLDYQIKSWRLPPVLTNLFLCLWCPLLFRQLRSPTETLFLLVCCSATSLKYRGEKNFI